LLTCDEDVRYLPAKEGTAVAAADTLSIIPSIAGGD
jgi:adenylyltransferase/sulfurtransferase